MEIRNNICNKILFQTYNKCCPIRSERISLTNIQKSWFDIELRIVSKIKQDLFKQCRAGFINLNTYESFNNEFKAGLV